MGNKKHISGLGFFNYFKNIIGWHIYAYLVLNFLVGLLDGLGLAMFVPLLAIATGSNTGNESLGNLEFLIDFIHTLGIELNLQNALLLMVGLFALKNFFFYLRIIYFNKIRIMGLLKIKLDLVSGLKNLSYKGFTTMDAGKIQNNMIGETANLIMSMTFYFSSIQHIVMLITYVFLAFSSNWQFAIMVGIGGCITNILYRYINKIVKNHARNKNLIGHDFSGNLTQSINNFKYLKATNYFKNYETKLNQNIHETERINYKIGKISAMAESLREPMIIIVIALVILIQVNVMGGNFGTILVSLLLFYRALAHLVNMQNSWIRFMETSVSLESVESLLSEFKKYEEVSSYTDDIKSINDILVKDAEVIFDGNPALKNINLTIPNKTSIALVGESGAGKTTLANLICGLLPPNKGEVITNNQSIYNSNLDSFRSKVGYITQEPVIFDDTIFNNVTFWAEKTPENLEKFYNAMNMVSMKSFVENLDRQENTPLGNNGVLISGGQKQRISIARELYKDIDLLIMDEATSALDSETEKYIKDNIDLLHGKFTIVIIAHRLSTIKNVDKVYLLEKGEILDSGNYNELIEKSARFKRMVELQEV
jgi:ABC transporter, transmembrane region